MRERALSFSSSDPLDCLHACLHAGLGSKDAPTEVEIERQPATLDALLALRQAAREISMSWENFDVSNDFANWRHDFLLIDDGIVKSGADRQDVNLTETMRLLREIPFELATGGPIDSKWWHDYSSPHFTGHYPFGWMCAFKGEGHHRVVSRRFLDYGPWRLVRDEANDLSLVQFHDLDADEATALAQARPGHRHLMDWAAGGVIAEGEVHYEMLPNRDLLRTDLGYVYREFKPNLYDESSRTSVVLVHDREVTLREMMEACAARLWQPFPGIAIEQVAFVFFDPAQARRQLFDLWVRGLEVRAIEPAGETRLDLDFEPPPPEAPDWVRRVREREGF